MFQRKKSEQAIKVNNFTKLVELLERCALTCSTCFFCYCDTRYKIPQMPVWSVSQTIVFSDLITHSGDNVQTGERYDMINLVLSQVDEPSHSEYVQRKKRRGAPGHGRPQPRQQSKDVGPPRRQLCRECRAVLCQLRLSCSRRRSGSCSARV